MIKIFSLVVLFFISKCNAQTTLQQLQFIPFKNFVGQPVDTLLHHLPSGITSIKVFGIRHHFYGDALRVSFTNNIYIEIGVTEFHYMNPFRNKIAPFPYNYYWDVSLFKKENMAFVVVFNGNNCLSGCGNLH